MAVGRDHPGLTIDPVLNDRSEALQRKGSEAERHITTQIKARREKQKQSDKADHKRAQNSKKQASNSAADKLKQKQNEKHEAQAWADAVKRETTELKQRKCRSKRSANRLGVTRHMAHTSSTASCPTNDS